MRLTVDYCTVYILYYIHGYIVLVKPDSLINICIVFEVRRWLFFSVSGHARYVVCCKICIPTTATHGEMMLPFLIAFVFMPGYMLEY